MNRVIEIECKGQTLQNAKKVHDSITKNFGFAGPIFINEIKKDEVFEEIQLDQQAIFERLSAKGTDKQALSASILLAADHAAEKIIFKDGIRLEEADILSYLRTNADVDSGRRAHEYLLEWIAENKINFVFDGNQDENRLIYGCVETDGIGRAEKVWIIGKIFNSALLDGGFNPDSYLSWAYGEGLILAENGLKKVVKRIPGSGITARCVCLLINHDEKKNFSDSVLPWEDT